MTPLSAPGPGITFHAKASAKGRDNRLGRTGRHHADDLLVESEYPSVLKVFPRYAGRARRGATVAGDHLRGTAVVVENASRSRGHYGASVIQRLPQRCDELVAETLVVPFCVIVEREPTTKIMPAWCWQTGD